MSIPDTPYTRKEAYLNAIATGDSGDIPETPYTREEMYLDEIARNGGGGGGGDISVVSKSITSNGTYTAPSGKAYSPVTVDVPNSYAAGDEGKVVSNGALVAQTAHAEVTQNGTIDTTLNDSVVVNVSGGSSWELVGSAEFEVTTSSTTATSVGDVDLDVDSISRGDIFWAHIRDKAGKREGYFYGSESICIIYADGRSVTPKVAFGAAGTLYSTGATSNSVYLNAIVPWTKIAQIYSKYSSAIGTVDGTYKVDVYKLTPASGMVPMLE